MTPGWIVSGSLLLIVICTGCVGGAEQWVYRTDKPTKHWTCVSNGFMGVKVPAEGQGWTTKEQARLRPHIIAGHWTYFGKDGKGTERGQWRAATDAVIWSEVGYNDGKAWLDAATGEMTDYSQSIDIKRSVVRTRFRWVNGERATDVDVEIFASRDDRHLGVVRYTIRPQFDGEVQFSCPIRSIFKLKAASLPGDKDKSGIWMYTQTSPPGRAPLAAASQVIMSDSIKDGRIERPKAATSGSSALGDGKVDWLVRFKAQKGKAYTITKFVAVFADTGTASGNEMKVSDKRFAKLVTDAQTLAAKAAQDGYDAALKQHVAGWAKIWKTDIIIDGPEDDQRAIRAFTYYTIGALHEDEPYGQAVCGLTWWLYGGGIFGDMENFILPPMSVMHPPIAASMLRYRYNIIPMSRELRKARGLSKGIEYAWDARWDGFEHAPRPYSENRRMTAYVGYAAWRYYLATRDMEWLKTIGWPILKETADYWTVRSTYNKAEDRYEVHDVMPPTEAEIVKNNSYTNGYVRMNLLCSIDAAKLLGKTPDPKWVEVYEKMYFPVDKERKIYIFHDKSDPAKPPWASDIHFMIYPMEHFEGDVGVARVVRDFTGRKVDPANVTDEDRKVSRDVMQAVADYSFPRTRPGFPSLTSAKNAGGYNAINDREGVYKQFRSWARSTNGPFYICNEMGGRKNPKQEIFVSGTGGYMTGLIYGIAGLRLRPEGIQFNPLLPKEWKSLVLKNFHFGDGVYDVTITAGDKIKVKLVSGKANIRIYTADGKTLFEPDK